MSEIPGDLKFLKSHEWARLESDGRVTVGISDHAQGLLGDLVYVELPNVGDRIEAGNASAVVAFQRKRAGNSGASSSACTSTCSALDECR